MESETPLPSAHPQGERLRDPGERWPVDTFAGRCHVSFDDDLAVSPSGALVGFVQFLKTSGLFDRLCANAPLAYASPNAPAVRDVLGTLVLGILGGATRFAHLSSLRHDALATELFGMSRVMSEDSVRRALKGMEIAPAHAWVRGELAECVRHAVSAAPWVLDVDVTVKPVYGRRQEGAKVSYNPAKPGRPGLVHHTLWMSRTRLCLDVDVRPGDEHAAAHGLARLVGHLRALPDGSRPALVRGDCGYGSESWMAAMDALKQPYLFKVRMSANVRRLARAEPGPDEAPWEPDERGWECRRTMLRCDSWPEARAVVVQRRRRTPDERTKAKRLLKKSRKGADTLFEAAALEVMTEDDADALDYEYAVLATNLPYEPPSVCRLYRDRGDAENPFDELKNQWGWGGFTVRHLGPTQITALLVALVYDWWSLYTRLVLPGRHRESITSRPLLMGGVARKTEHAGQKHITVKLMHAACERTKAGVVAAFRFLGGLMATAEQLSPCERWRRIESRIIDSILTPLCAIGLKGPT